MTTHHISSDSVKAKAARTRLARKEIRTESLTFLDGGAKLYLDGPPGIGVVVEFRSRKCYYRDVQTALDGWYKDWAKTFGSRDSQGALTRAEGTKVTHEEDWRLPGAPRKDWGAIANLGTHEEVFGVPRG